MRLEFLGDVYDHWKGSLCEHLTQAGLLRDLVVDPLSADTHDWTPADVELYSRLLRVPAGRIRLHRTLGNERRAYFAEILHPGDLFIDPDTGIASGRVRDRWKYILPNELGGLLTPDTRVVAVYQHVARQQPRQRLQIIMNRLGREIPPFVCCSYESANAAMLFFSRTKTRVLAIRNYFHQLLGDHATRRVMLWEWNAH